jgi:AcrR family transcriptional regulator
MDSSVTRPAGAPVLRIAEKSPAAPVQHRSIERQRKLLAAGRHVFAAKGFEAASVGEIARRAGTASGGFYVYFSSKRGFLVALMNEFVAGLARLDLGQGLAASADAGPGKQADARATLRAFLAAAFRVDRANFGVVRAWQEATLTDRELAKLEREIQAWTERRILGVFQLLQKSAQARQNCDLAGFARMMDRHFWSLLARGSRLTASEFDREVQVSADVICAYLFE